MVVAHLIKSVNHYCIYHMQSTALKKMKERASYSLKKVHKFKQYQRGFTKLTNQTNKN